MHKSYQIIHLMVAIITLIATSKAEIYLPLTYKYLTEPTNPQTFMESLSYCIIQSKINLGTPGQELTYNLDTEEYYFFTLGSEVPGTGEKFDETQSASYVSLEKPEIPHRGTTYFSYYSLSTDTFNYKQLNIENFNFILARNLSSYKSLNGASGAIGLKIGSDHADIDKKYNLIKELKRTDCIEHEIFTFDFNNDQMIIGDYPHEYDENFDKISLKNIYSASTTHWRLIFEQISFGEYNNIQNDTGLCRIRPDYIGNIATFGFKSIFYKYMAKYPIICTRSDFNMSLEYEYYYCASDSFDIKSLPDISFFDLELNMTFNLTSEDYTVFYQNQVYINILFPKNKKDSSEWVLGKSFIKKFKPVFNLDSKSIYFYDQSIKREEEKTNSSKFHWSFIVLIILILVFVGIAAFYKLKLSKNRISRKRGIEMSIDDYVYMPDLKS